VSALLLELEPGARGGGGGGGGVGVFFRKNPPLRGHAGRADWRLCGRLSALIAAGRLSGARGEAVLIPATGGLRVPMLVALGAGARDGFDEAAWCGLARDVVERSLRLGAHSVALPLPPAEGGLGLRPRLEGMVREAAAALAEIPETSGAELRLRVVSARDEVVRSAELLRNLRPRGLPESVTLRVSPGPDRYLDPQTPPA
jgi:hypothetical protein